jgi:hypothetical protein
MDQGLNPFISVPGVVGDILLIEICDHTLAQQQIVYRILHPSKVIARKDSFKAYTVQFRINHLNDGPYEIEFSLSGRLMQTMRFTKRSLPVF